jgi:hypothetical protein
LRADRLYARSGFYQTRSRPVSGNLAEFPFFSALSFSEGAADHYFGF